MAASGAGARDGGSSRSYHPNRWIAQAAARVAARAAAGSGCPGRLGLKRLGRLAIAAARASMARAERLGWRS